MPIKRLASAVLFTVSLVLFPVLAQAAGAAISPRVIKVTPTSGIRTIAGLKVGPVKTVGPTTFTEVKSQFGKPAYVKKPYGDACAAYYGFGLKLTFLTFGGATACGEMPLQIVTLRTDAWRMDIGRKTYRVGMSKSVIPAGVRRVPHYGYQLASQEFVGRQSASTYAKLDRKGKRITRISTLIGGAGD